MQILNQLISMDRIIFKNIFKPAFGKRFQKTSRTFVFLFDIADAKATIQTVLACFFESCFALSLVLFLAAILRFILSVQTGR